MSASRTAARIYAWTHGYFWLPCPLCGEHFGGHEWADLDGLPSVIPTDEPRRYQGICPKCTKAGKGKRVAEIREEWAARVGREPIRTGFRPEQLLADLAAVADQLVDHTIRADHETFCVDDGQEHPLNLCPHLDSAGAAALRLRAMVTGDEKGPETGPKSILLASEPDSVHDQGERSTTRILGTTDGQITESTTEDGPR